MAQHCGLDGELGVKGKSSVLASKATREAFLRQSRVRITSAGCLNYPCRTPILQILSLTLFEKIPLDQLLNDTALENFDGENPTQLNLFS
jgi:hypothetical protein